MSEEKRSPKTPRTIDPASQEMLDRADRDGVPVVWDRYEKMLPQCGFGSLGMCCRNCVLGPCRIDPFGDGPKAGVCGASVDVIAARNLIRMIAGGAAAHSDHGRDVAHTLLLAAEGKAKGYEIKDEMKLLALARELEVETKDKDYKTIAKEVAEICLAEFGKQEGEILFAQRAPEATKARWHEHGVFPRGVDREIVEIMHRTHIGVDNEPKSLILQGCRACLADGWGGSMIATDLQDVMFGLPHPIKASTNLGVLDAESVNIIVHGHEPTLSDMIAVAAKDKEIVEAAKKVGAKGVNLAGMCCTANEILMRRGIPAAGNFLQQELAVTTGVVDAMIVDVQCIMPGLTNLKSCFHTRFISTSPKARFTGAEHIQFDEHNAYDIAKKILMAGIENFPNRDKAKVHIPKHKERLVAGFTTESVFDFLGGRYRSTYRPLNDGVMAGRLRGAAGVVGCNNPKVCHDYGHVEMTKELLRNDVLVVVTGCTAIADAKQGLLRPEAAYEYCGEGLKEICRAVGIPPVLHLGSCVDNSRVLTVLTNVVHEGGLGESIADLPVAGAAPEWMSEKAVSIGFYFVVSGVYTVLGQPFPIEGSEVVTNFVCDEIEQYFGGKFAFEPDPIKGARLMIDHIDRKRAALRLPPPMYEQPYAPKEVAEKAAAGSK